MMETHLRRHLICENHIHRSTQQHSVSRAGALRLWRQPSQLSTTTQCITEV